MPTDRLALKEYKRAYRIRNRLKINEWIRDWKRRNPEKMRKSRKRYWKNHGEEQNVKKRAFRKSNPNYDRAYTRRVREEVIKHYGGKCVCCDVQNYEFLSIDHKNGHGLEHRRKLSIEGQKFIFWLRRNNYPEEFQILCHNCNQSLGHYGYCPHQPDIKRKVLHGNKK